MPIPPTPPLDETITPGQLGHIADHEAIHDALNNDTMSLTSDQTVSGATTFLEDAFLDKGNLAFFIKAYGATGLGIADDTAAIQAALDACAAAGGGVVWGNTGKYRVTKIVVPRGVHFIGPGISGFGNTSEYGCLLFQDAGTEDDMVVFESVVSSGRAYIGPLSVKGFEMLGDNTATVGSGIAFVDSAGANGTIQDTVEVSYNIIRGFAEDGIRIPDGALPLHLHDLNLLFNGRYGINYIAGANITQAVHFDNISGDGNLSGLIHCQDVDDRGSLLFTNIKSEKRINPDYGSVAGQENAIILEDCVGTAVHIAGATHISSVPDGGNFEAPGALVEIVATTATDVPKLTWEGVAVRLRPSDTGAVQGPILRDLTNAVTVANGQASGSYGPHDEFLLITPTELFATVGTPALAAVATSRRVVMQFDAAADELAAGMLAVPKDWHKASVTYQWVNSGAGAGDVRWEFQGDYFEEGEDWDVADSQSSSVTETAGTLNVVVASTMAASFTLVPGTIFRYRVKRAGTAGGDTLANDAGFAGAVLTRLL